MTKQLQTKNYKKNYLLKIGIITFLAFTCLNILLEYLEIGDKSSRSTKFNDINVMHLLIMGVLLAPILEEITFRGSFLKSKSLKYISYAFLFGITLMSENYFIIPFALLFVFFRESKQNPNFIKYSYFANALLFGLVHYKFSDLAIVNTYPGILGTAGLTLILIWLVLNFGLWASMLAHFALNFSAISIGVISYENSDFSLKKIETQDFEMTYQKVSLFDKEGTTNYHKGKELDAKTTTISSVYQMLCPDSKLDEVYFGQYNLTIKRKPNSQKVLDCATFKELLDKSKIEEE